MLSLSPGVPDVDAMLGSAGHEWIDEAIKALEGNGESIKLLSC
jgi:hypothetical protein